MPISALRGGNAAAPCAPMPLSCSAHCCSLRHRAGSPEPTRRPSERRRAASESSILIAPSASPHVRRSQSAPCAAATPPRRARRCPSRAQLTDAPYVTAPAQPEPTRRPSKRRRAASESSILIVPSASPNVRRSQSAPCAAATAAAPCAPMPLSCSAHCCSLRHCAGSPEPTRRPSERRRAASESSILIAPSASPNVRRSPSAPCAAATAAAPCAPVPLSCSAHCCPFLRHRAGSFEPTRRPSKRRRAASESSILIAPSASPNVRRSQPAPRAAATAAAPCAPMPLSCSAHCCPFYVTAPAHSSRHDDRASAAEPRASRRSWSRRWLRRTCVDPHPRLARRQPPPRRARRMLRAGRNVGQARGPSRRVTAVIASALRIVFTESHRPPRDRVGRRRVSGCSVRDRPHVPVPRRRMSLCNVAAARCLCLRTVIIVGSDAVGSRLRLRHCQVPVTLDRRQR